MVGAGQQQPNHSNITDSAVVIVAPQSRILAIAQRCPVHRTLTAETRIVEVER